MDDAETWLYLVLAAGVGYALYIAAGELGAGIRTGVQEYRARRTTDQADRTEYTRHRSQKHGHHRPRGSTTDDAPSQDTCAYDGSTPQPWYEVLRVHSTASREEMQQGYRRVIALYHPDRVAGLGPELRALAEQRSKEINAAYEFACGLFDSRRPRH